MNVRIMRHAIDAMFREHCTLNKQSAIDGTQNSVPIPKLLMKNDYAVRPGIFVFSCIIQVGLTFHC